jgi:hypothetical protein
MTGAGDFAKLVPGFDFLQSLMKGAASALPGLPGLPGAPGIPGMGQWIAPTLDPAEIEKRISELKTVQFWLEQNARLLGATIQALEVQRMTLSTLKTMNLPLADLGEALKVRLPEVSPSIAAAPPAAETAEPVAAPVARSAPKRKPTARKTAAADGKATTAPAAAPAAIDPMQWWGALTQQFTELATQAVKDRAADAAQAATLAKDVAKKVAGGVVKTATGRRR